MMYYKTLFGPLLYDEIYEIYINSDIFQTGLKKGHL